MKNNLEEQEFTNKFMLFWAAGSMFLFFVYIFSITFLHIPAANQKFADTIIGFLAGTLVSTVVNFYYGSSNASKIKDKTLQNITGGSENNSVIPKNITQEVDVPASEQSEVN